MEALSRGNALAREQIVRLAPFASAVARRIGGNPVLAIVATDDASGRKFVRIKEEALAGIAIDITASWLHATAQTGDALALIAGLNARPDVDGVFLQFPLPDGVEVQALLKAIAVEKDIDGSTEIGRFRPAAAIAACDLLCDQAGSLEGRNVVIAAKEDAFTRALCHLVGRNGGSARTLEVGDADSAAAMRDVHALVITEEMLPTSMQQHLSELPLLLDAGYYLPPRPSDFISEELKPRISRHLTQYGNVGPLTVAHLAAATIAAAER